MMYSRLSLRHVEARACRELWCAVLLTTLRDLCQPAGKSHDRIAAERWVGDWPDRNFRMICHLAGINPDWLHGALARLVRLPVRERRNHLATMLNCPPGRIEACLVVRQEAFGAPSRQTDKGGRTCGCTDDDCRGCIEGELFSACGAECTP